MKRNVVSFRSNAKLARQLWGETTRVTLRSLRELTARYSLSVAAGDLQLLDGRWYVTHSGLLQLASRKGCRESIRTYKRASPMSGWVAGFSKQPSSRVHLPKDSLVTATPIPRTFLLWCEAPNCGLLRLAPSIALCEKPTASAFARSKSWVCFRVNGGLSLLPRLRMGRILQTTPAMGPAMDNPGSGISFAC